LARFNSGGQSGGAPSPPTLGLVAGEDLDINEAVMIDGADNRVMVCTVAKQEQVIGIMKANVANAAAVNGADIALMGEVVEGIVGVAIVRGDRLTVQVTTGRLGPFNATPTHKHTVFTFTTTGVVGAGTTHELQAADTGTFMREGAYRLGLRRGANDVGGITGSPKSNLAGAQTTGTVIGKALETNAGVGTTFKMLVMGGL